MWFIAENKFCEVRLWTAAVVVEVRTWYTYTVNIWAALHRLFSDRKDVYHCPVQTTYFCVNLRKKEVGR